jgi:hypothetical protein
VLFHAAKLGRTDVIQVMESAPSRHYLFSSLSSIQSRNKINLLMLLIFYQQLMKMATRVCILHLNLAILMLFEHYW